MATHQATIWQLARLAALLAGGLHLAGCSAVPLPAIDPSGERIFLPSPSYTTFAAPYEAPGGLSCLPQPAFTEPPPIPTCSQAPPPRPATAIPGTPIVAAPPAPVATPDRLLLSPARIVAPINSEVVLLAGLCGRDGYFVTKQPIEWMLSPDSVGNIIALGESAHPHLARLAHHSPRKECNNLAITRTSTAAHVVTRGTPAPNDDVWVNKGQTWISVSSPTEGVSYVTAVAQRADNWETRRQTAAIYWVDMQWAFPAPRIVPAGEPSLLRTTVTKTSTGNPAANAVVRYEVIGGAPAFFEAGRTTIEVPTDANGNADAQLFQDPIGPGTTQVRIQILSRTFQGDPSAQAVIGQGFTTVTWSSPGLALTMTGPSLVARNGIATYRIDVTNPGDVPTEQVQVTVDVPPGLRYVDSQPSARPMGNRLEWLLTSLPAKAVQTLTFNCQAANSGEFQVSARAVSAATQIAAATAVVETRVVESGITVRFVDPPATATLGSRVGFNFEVTNTGGLPLTNVVARDRFDPGLQPAYENVDPSRPLELVIGNLAAGETRRQSVSFIARTAGRLCHTLEVTADGGHRANAQTCIDIAQPRLQVDVRKVGPPAARVGETVRFTISVTNTGEGVLTNLQIADIPDEQHLQAVKATQIEGGLTRRESDRAIVWRAGTLGPQQTRIFEIECTCLAETPAARNQVEVTADGGVRETAEARIAIQPRAEPPRTPPATPAAPASPPPAATAGKLIVQITDLVDPCPVGGTASWVVVVRNESSEPDSDVYLTISIPEGFDRNRLSVQQDMKVDVTRSRDGSLLIGPIRTVRGGETLPRIRIEAPAIQPGRYSVRARAESRRAPLVEASDEITVLPRG